MIRNTSGQHVGAEILATDGTEFTGSVSVAVTGDAGTQGAGGGSAPAHEGLGFHSYSPTQAETNFAHVAFTFTGTGAIPATVQVYPQIAQPTAAQIADAVLTRDWLDTVAAVGTIPARSALNALRALRNAWAVAAGVWTVTEEDDSTPVFSKPVTGAPGADPLSGVGADD